MEEAEQQLSFHKSITSGTWEACTRPHYSTSNFQDQTTISSGDLQLVDQQATALKMCAHIWMCVLPAIKQYF